MVTVDASASPRLFGHRKRSTAVLSVAELLSWGVLYYSFPVAAPRVADATGWSSAALAAVYSLCLVSAAIAGLWISKLVDADGSLRRWMPICSMIGVAGLLVSATGNFWLFLLGWVLVGVAQAGTLWPPAFIAITRWYEGRDSAWPMTVITAIGGSASFVFAPLVAYMMVNYGWQKSFVLLAVGYGVLSLLLQIGGLTAKWTVTPVEKAASRREVRQTTRQARFILLQACMLVTGVALFSVTLNLVHVAEEKGASYTEAAFIFGLVGLGQVLGRIAFTAVPNKAGPSTNTVGLMVSAAVVLAVLAFVPPVLALSCLAVGAGCVRGAHTLLMRDGVLQRWGTKNFGAVMALFNLPVAIAIAISPAIGAGLAAAFGSYTVAVLIAAAAVGAMALLAPRT